MVQQVLVLICFELVRRHIVKIVCGQNKFVKSYIKTDVVDGIALKYSFSSFVDDIRRHKDEDGDNVIRI